MACRDRWLAAGIGLLATGLATTAGLALSRQLVFGFDDAASHVLIPSRVFDNAEPSLAQLGIQWPPFFHVLQLPVSWFDPLVETGAAGMGVSIVASLVTGVYLYRLAYLVTDDRRAGFLAAVLLATSPSFLYAGVIPMLPATITACVTANVYYLTKWANGGGGGLALIAAGLSLSAATLTHYETWVLVPLEAGVVLLVASERWRHRPQIEATLILWLFSSSYGLAVFLLMNVVIAGDPLAFLGASGGVGDILEGKPDLAGLLDHPQAAWATAGGISVVASAVGAVWYAVRVRRRPTLLVPALLLYPLAFYAVQAITTGSLIEPGRELGDWRNLRYGVTVLPGLLFFVAVGFSRLPAQALAVGAVVLWGAYTVHAGRVAMWEDAQHDVPAAQAIREAGRWLSGRAGRDAEVIIPNHPPHIDQFELASRLDSRDVLDGNDQEGVPPPRGLAGDEPHRERWLIWLGHDKQALVRDLVKASGATLCYGRALPDPSTPFIRIYSLGPDCA